MIVPEIEPVTDDDDFDFDFSSVIQDAKRDLDDIPWDPEEFKLIMTHLRDNAPALPDPVKEKPIVDDEPVIDFTMIDAAIRAAQREGK